MVNIYVCIVSKFLCLFKSCFGNDLILGDVDADVDLFALQSLMNMMTILLQLLIMLLLKLVDHRTIPSLITSCRVNSDS